jgi:flagellin-like protein
MRRSDRRAASSVVGVLLVVALAVVLAGVVATFALGIGEQTQEVPPTGAFEFEYHNSTDTASYLPDDPTQGSANLTVIYTHGEPIPSDRVNVTVRGATERDQNGNVIGENLVFEPNFAGGGNLFGNTDTVSAGDEYTISDNDFLSKDGSGNLGELRKLDLSRATITVYWLSETGENSAIIGQWTGPDT